MTDELDGEELTQAELAFAARLRELFARVDAAQPERGVRALVRRARRIAREERRAPEVVLDELYAGAVRRTERRLELAARSACTRRRR